MQSLCRVCTNNIHDKSLFASGIYKLLLAPGQCNMKKLPQTTQSQMAKISPKSDAATYILHIFGEKNSRSRSSIVVEKKSQLLTKLGRVFFVSTSNSPRSGHAVQPWTFLQAVGLMKNCSGMISQKVEKKEGFCKISQQPSVVFKLLLPAFRSWRLLC